eukprot:SAG11_NODE_1116_length_5800_cov_21.451149_3_plen_91_part_00
MNTDGRRQVGECTRYGYGRVRVRRVRVLPVRAHRRSSSLKLRVPTGGLNVSRGTRSTSTEVTVSVLYGSSRDWRTSSPHPFSLRVARKNG